MIAKIVTTFTNQLLCNGLDGLGYFAAVAGCDWLLPHSGLEWSQPSIYTNNQYTISIAYDYKMRLQNGMFMHNIKMELIHACEGGLSDIHKDREVNTTKIFCCIV